MAHSVEPAKAIEPGSTESGDRQVLEQGLSAVSGGGAAPTATGAPAPGPLANPENPLGALIDGEVAGDPNGQVTDGLSVGAGTGPAGAPDIMLGDKATRLRSIANEASSPQVRAAARSELRRMTRDPT